MTPDPDTNRKHSPTRPNPPKTSNKTTNRNAAAIQLNKLDCDRDGIGHYQAVSSNQPVLELDLILPSVRAAVLDVWEHELQQLVAECWAIANGDAQLTTDLLATQINTLPYYANCETTTTTSAQPDTDKPSHSSNKQLPVLYVNTIAHKAYSRLTGQHVAALHTRDAQGHAHRSPWR